MSTMLWAMGLFAAGYAIGFAHWAWRNRGLITALAKYREALDKSIDTTLRCLTREQERQRADSVRRTDAEWADYLMQPLYAFRPHNDSDVC